MLARTCQKCGSSADNRRCSVCKAVYYCSRSCQVADFRTHKKLCIQLHREQSTPSPPVTSTTANSRAASAAAATAAIATTATAATDNHFLGISTTATTTNASSAATSGRTASSLSYSSGNTTTTTTEMNSNNSNNNKNNNNNHHTHSNGNAAPSSFSSSSSSSTSILPLPSSSTTPSATASASATSFASPSDNNHNHNNNNNNNNNNNDNHNNNNHNHNHNNNSTNPLLLLLLPENPGTWSRHWSAATEERILSLPLAKDHVWICSVLHPPKSALRYRHGVLSIMDTTSKLQGLTSDGLLMGIGQCPSPQDEEHEIVRAILATMIGLSPKLPEMTTATTTATTTTTTNTMSLSTSMTSSSSLSSLSSSLLTEREFYAPRRPGFVLLGEDLGPCLVHVQDRLAIFGIHVAYQPNECLQAVRQRHRARLRRRSGRNNNE